MYEDAFSSWEYEHAVFGFNIFSMLPAEQAESRTMKSEQKLDEEETADKQSYTTFLAT